MKLRNGIEVTDIRLGRIPQFDERSKNFRIRDLLADKPLRSYTWRCDTVLDQLNTGSCVGHAIAHELIARPAEVKGIDRKFAESLYWQAQKIDEWEGGSYPGADPFYEGTSVLAGVRIGKKLGFFDGYVWGFNLNDVLIGIGYHGPAILGINWYEDMFDLDAQGFIHPTGQIAGGHAILCNAIDVAGSYVKLHNSWGVSWGVNGEAKLRFKDLDKLLKNDGEAVFFVHRHMEPKP